MSKQSTSSKILADWNYAPGEWFDFIEFEKETRRKEIVAAASRLQRSMAHYTLNLI